MLRFWLAGHAMVRALGGIALGGLAASPAAADPAIVEQWVARAAESAVIDLAADDIFHDPQAGRTTVTGLSIELSLDEMARVVGAMVGASEDVGTGPDGAVTYRLRFPAIAFDGLAAGDGYLSADAVEADVLLVDAEIDVEDADIGPTSVIYEGLSITDLRWAQWPEVSADPDRPASQFLPILRALTDVSFAQMSINQVIARSAIPDRDGEVVQRLDGIGLSDASGGDIGRLTIEAYAMSAPDEESGEPVAVAAGPISATDYNYGTMIDVMFGDTNTDEYATAVGAFSIADMRVSAPGEGFSLRIDAIAANDIGVRSPQTDILSYLDALIVAGRADPDFEPEAEALIRLVGGIYGAFRLGEFEVSGIVFDTGDEASGLLAAYGLRDLSAAGLGSAYLRGLDVRGKDGEHIRYDQFEVNEIGFPALEALIALGMASEDGEPPAELVLAALPTLGRIINAGVRVRVPEQGTDFALDGSVFEMSDHIGPIPTRLALTVDRLQVNVADLEPQMREAISGLGYDQLVLSADMLARWEAATGDVHLEAAAELAEGGRLALEGLIGGVPRLIFERPDQTAAMALLGATFKRLDARFDDASIVERGVALAAAEQDVSPEAIRAQLSAIVPVMLAELGDAELAARATAAIGQLVDNGTPVALSIGAPSPVPLVALGMSMRSNPASIVEALEIDVTNPQ